MSLYCYLTPEGWQNKTIIPPKNYKSKSQIKCKKEKEKIKCESE